MKQADGRCRTLQSASKVWGRSLRLTAMEVLPMNPPSNPLFAEKSLTLVAALFGDGQQAKLAAERLRQAQDDVDVVQPNDRQWMRKLEPEGRAIRRGAFQSHVVLMTAGFVLGVLVSFLLINTWAAAAASPLLTGISVTLILTLVGGIVAGLLTLRPDRSAVAVQVKEGLRKGRWAVVAHPRDEAAAVQADDTLRNAGGDVLRSI
jgi:hypothetical protein